MLFLRKLALVATFYCCCRLKWTQVSQWKNDLLDYAGSLFEGKLGLKRVKAQSGPDWLCANIVQLNMKLDWHNKV